MTTATVVETPRTADFITREEFIKHETVAKSKFKKIYEKIEASATSIDNINGEVGEIKIQTAIIGAQVEAIMNNIDTMSRNMDNQFDLLRDNAKTREEKNLLMMEKIAEDVFDKEHATDEAHKNKPEATDGGSGKGDKAADGKGGIISLILTGLTAILVAAINILPNLLNHP